MVCSSPFLWKNARDALPSTAALADFTTRPSVSRAFTQRACAHGGSVTQQQRGHQICYTSSPINMCAHAWQRDQLNPAIATQLRVWYVAASEHTSLAQVVAHVGGVGKDEPNSLVLTSIVRCAAACLANVDNIVLDLRGTTKQGFRSIAIYDGKTVRTE